MLSEAWEAWRPGSGLFSAWLCYVAWEDTGVSLVLEEAGVELLTVLGFQTLDLFRLVSPCSTLASEVRWGACSPLSPPAPSLGWAPGGGC